MTAITVPQGPLAPAAPMSPRAFLLLALAGLMLWLVVFENGAMSQLLSGSGTFLHELFHDGRHLIGAPCH